MILHYSIVLKKHKSNEFILKYSYIGTFMLFCFFLYLQSNHCERKGQENIVDLLLTSY